MTSNNVVLFPITRTKPTSTDVLENLVSAKEEDVDDIVDLLHITTVELLEKAGFDFTSSVDCIKDLCFFLEAQRSLIYKHYELEHAFQGLSEQCFELTEHGVIFTDPVFMKKEEDASDDTA